MGWGGCAGCPEAGGRVEPPPLTSQAGSSGCGRSAPWRGPPGSRRSQRWPSPPPSSWRGTRGRRRSGSCSVGTGGSGWRWWWGGRDHPAPQPPRAHLGADKALLPGGDAGEVELLDSLTAEVEIQALGGDSELEGHGLVGFCHLGGLLAPGGARGWLSAGTVPGDGHTWHRAPGSAVPWRRAPPGTPHDAAGIAAPPAPPPVSPGPPCTGTVTLRASGAARRAASRQPWPGPAATCACPRGGPRPNHMGLDGCPVREGSGTVPLPLNTPPRGQTHRHTPAAHPAAWGTGDTAASAP